jgi:hypothetical protein
MIHVLHVMMWLTNSTGIFFPFWLRLPAILADSASLWVVSRIFARRLDEPSIRWTLLLLAVSPVLILVSGFHGNTDSVVILFVLLSVWFTADRASGAALGAAMCVKVFPLIVLPVLFFYRPGLRRRARFLASAAAVIVVGWSPYLFEQPAAILHQVIGYQSRYGSWGLSWLASHLTFIRDGWNNAFRQKGAYAVMAVITIAAFAVNRSRKKPSAYAQVGCALFFFLAASSGFGVQYLAWLVPWTVGLGIIPVAFFTAASGAFLFLVYNYWSGGFPWYLADSNCVGDFAGHLDYFQALCWFSVIVLVWAAWHRHSSTTLPNLRTRLAASALAVSLVVYPMWKQLRVDVRTWPPAADRAALVSILVSENTPAITRPIPCAYLVAGEFSNAR